jgi:peptidoglycan hydrolase-like protein with peptidoglycan-binding domain
MSFQTPMIKPTSPITKGEPVRSRQALLILRGFDPGPLDGQYGEKSQAAARAYQTARGLQADAWIGDKTLAALLDG